MYSSNVWKIEIYSSFQVYSPQVRDIPMKIDPDGMDFFVHRLLRSRTFELQNNSVDLDGYRGLSIMLCTEMHKQQYEISNRHSFAQVFINLIKFAVLAYISHIRS
jgi:hypothetical protein